MNQSTISDLGMQEFRVQVFGFNGHSFTGHGIHDIAPTVFRVAFERHSTHFQDPSSYHEAAIGE
jgi:hypothetical protein